VNRDHRFCTLIITPATSSRFYKIILHHRHFYAATIASLVGLALLTLTSIWVFKQAGLLINYHRIQSENQWLKQRQSVVLRQLESRLASIKAESDRIRQMAAEMGLSVDNEVKTATDEASSGVGGPSKFDSFANELDRVAANLRRLRENLDAEKTRLATTPTGWPAPGRVNSGYGVRRDPFGEGYEFHSGVDIRASYGHPVRATADGVVIYASYRGGYGRLVVLDHGRGIRTFYGHLSRITVSVGDRVRRGHQLGRVGSTGRATAAHVHYEIRMKDRPINPWRFGSSR
jgi:murein DD-endopeptidase MepM/ murein hydrolase activator NlpD